MMFHVYFQAAPCYGSHTVVSLVDMSIMPLEDLTSRDADKQIREDEEPDESILPPTTELPKLS